MGDSGLGRQTALDQTGRSQCLRYTVSAGAAGILRAARDDDTELGRNDIQAFRAIFADAMQAAAAGAGQAVRFDHNLDTRQMGGQRAAVGVALFGRTLRFAILSVFFGVKCGHSRLDILKREIELVGIYLLGTFTKGRLFEGSDKLLQRCDPGIFAQIGGLRLLQSRTQTGNLGKKILSVRHSQCLTYAI